MKKIKSFVAALRKNAAILLATTLLLTTAVTVYSTIYVGNALTVANTTTYSQSWQPINTTLNPGTFFVTDGGLTQTTALTLTLGWSFDNTNFTNVATWQAPATNATTNGQPGYAWTPGVITIPVYSRIQITTTNTVTNITVSQ